MLILRAQNMCSEGAFVSEATLRRFTVDKERRKTERFPTAAYFQEAQDWRRVYFEAFDADSGQMMGIVEDISASGLRLVSTQPIKHGVACELRIRLPEPIGERQNLTVTARALWSSRNIRSGLHQTGFHIISLANDQMELLTELLRRIADRARSAVNVVEN